LRTERLSTPRPGVSAFLSDDARRGSPCFPFPDGPIRLVENCRPHGGVAAKARPPPYSQRERARVTLNKAVGLLCLCASCGGSSSSGGTPPGGGTGAVLTLTVDGTPLDLSTSAGAIQSTPPYLTDIQGQDATGSNYVTLQLGAYPPVVATYSCPTNGVAILYSNGSAGFCSGVNSTALTGSTPTSCTITVTSYSAAGMPLEGTFSGTVAQADVPGSTHVISDGHFKLTAP
jgi:hypothetical protein